MSTYDLITRSAQGDSSAREQVLQENLGLVYMVTGRFKNRGVETEDLFQLAAIGLLKAIDHFNCDMGLQFSTYAVPMMMGEIRRYLRDNGPVKVSRGYKILAQKAAALREQLIVETGKEPSVSEIAARLSVEPAELSAALTAAKPPESLDEVRGDSEVTLKDLIPAKEEEEQLVNHLALSESINALPAREKAIILLRYFKGETQTKVAARLGISQVQVSRLEKKILTTLRNQL